MADRKCGCFAILRRCFRRPSLGVLKLQERLQPRPSSEALQRILHVDRPFLEQAGSLRPIHASASEVVELSDRGRCNNIASRERVFVTYVIQLGVTHVLPLRFRHPGGSAFRRLFHVPYFAIAARITAKLKTNPVSAMNVDTS